MSAFAADPVAFSESETLGAVIVDLYGAYNNTSLSFQNFSDGSALTEIVTLYQEYSSSASDPYTLAAIGAAAALAGTVAVVYDAITGRGYIQLYQEQYISSLDGFWDYTLNDLGFSRSPDGYFDWSVASGGSIVPVQLLLFYPGFGSLSSDPFYLATSRSQYVQTYYNYSISIDQPDCFVGSYTNGTNNYFVIVSSSYSGNYTASLYRDGILDSTFTDHLTPQSEGIYADIVTQYSPNISRTSYFNLSPVFSTFDVLKSSFVSSLSAPATLSLEPSVFIGDPLQNPESIDYPDPVSPDYAPRPVTIQTNVEWDDDWGNAPVADPTPGVSYPITDPATLNNLVPDLWSQLVANTVSVEAPQLDPAPDDPGLSPSEVFIPLLPVTLPSFNFSLSGIWHYVVTWVQSLGSWFSTMFTVWASLPYAMVVPVYATAVVVIVLGVYKRFFM